MTLRDAKLILSPLGISINGLPETGEYCVKRSGDTHPDSGYYTDDLEDAVDTGRNMARQPRLMSVRKPSPPIPKLSNADAELIIAGLVNTAIVLKFYRDVQEDDEAWQAIRSLVHRLNGNLDYETLTEEWV